MSNETDYKYCLENTDSIIAPKHVLRRKAQTVINQINKNIDNMIEDAQSFPLDVYNVKDGLLDYEVKQIIETKLKNAGLQVQYNQGDPGYMDLVISEIN